MAVIARLSRKLHVYIVRIDVYDVNMESGSKEHVGADIDSDVGRGTAGRLAAAALAIVTEENAGAVTMRRVAARAGVSAMASYRHYPNRTALLQAAADAGFAELGRDWGKRAAGVGFEERFAGLLDDFLDFALGRPNLYVFLLAERRTGARRFPADFRDRTSPAFTPLVDVIEQGMSEGVLRFDDPVEVALVCNTQAMGLVQMYLAGRIGDTESEFRTLCGRLVGRVLDGFRQ